MPTTEQTVAVFELIDDLREQIVRHYAPQIQECYRRIRVQSVARRTVSTTTSRSDASGEPEPARLLVKSARKAHICALLQTR